MLNEKFSLGCFQQHVQLQPADVAKGTELQLNSMLQSAIQIHSYVHKLIKDSYFTHAHQTV